MDLGLALSDIYNEFKRMLDLDKVRRIINYDNLKKDRDPELERTNAILQEHKTKLKKMFSQDELDKLPLLTEEF